MNAVSIHKASQKMQFELEIGPQSNQRSTSNNAYSQNKTIVLFSALYHPSMGGVETYTANLSKALATLGWNPIIVTMNTHKMPSVQTSNGAKILRLPCMTALNGRYPIPRLNKEYKNLVRDLLEQKVDYVVVNTRFYPLSCVGLSYARSKNITPVLIEHGSAHLTAQGYLASKAIEMIEHALTLIGKRYRASYYAVSKKASIWLRHFGITSQGELPNAIDADAFANGASTRDFRKEFKVADNELLIASIGRLVHEKGVLQIAQAVNNLASKGNCVHAIMAGSGSLENALAEEQSHAFNLAGRINHSDLAALLKQADILCLPSRSEGFATVLLEAAACETPALVSNVGGVDELIPDPRFGTILPNTASSTVETALLSACNNRQLIKEQGCNVAKRVRQQCSWSRTAQLVLNACEQAQK